MAQFRTLWYAGGAFMGLTISTYRTIIKTPLSAFEDQEGRFLTVTLLFDVVSAESNIVPDED